MNDLRLTAGISLLVDEFWARVPEDLREFPRDLARASSIALPVVTKELAGLSLDVVNEWLADRRLVESLDGRNRRLRGCLLAYGGYGILLVDANDPDNERRFTTAHELAHFLLDYAEPRRKAIDALGEGIVPVLDGVRSPTQTERLHSILSAVPLGMHVALMERTATGGYTARTTVDSEHEADRLALELLAPAADAQEAIKAVIGPGMTLAERHRQAAQLLFARYGLPDEQAWGYSKRLLKAKGTGPNVRDWLGIVR
jgi:hypothetical protein